MKRLTGAISWYPNRSWRLEFNYGHGVLDRGGTRDTSTRTRADQVGF